MPGTLRQVLSGTFVHDKIGQLPFLTAETSCCIISFSTFAKIRRQSCKWSQGAVTDVLQSSVFWVPSSCLQHHGQVPTQSESSRPAARARVVQHHGQGSPQTGSSSSVGKQERSHREDLFI